MSRTLQDARAAYGRRDWPRACELFTAARAEADLSADDLYALSDAAWWVGDNAELFRSCEAAYARYLEEGQPCRAATAATDIAVVHFLRGDEAPASGWISRASRLLQDQPEAAEHGYLLYLLEVEGPLGGIVAAQPGAADTLLASARRVQAIGRRHADPTLVAAGLLGEGRTLVKTGRVAEGLALLDEAMLAALADTLSPPWTGNIYCNLIEAAEELGDLRRAREWTDALTRWLATMPASVVFTGICRVHRSRVQQAAGAWDEAEREAARVCAEVGHLHVAAAAKAHYQVGEIRRLRGDAAGAEAAYQQAHRLGRDPQPGLALLRLAQGRIDAAAASIRTALLADHDRLRRAGLRAAHVEIALASGRLDEAATACGELEAIAAQYGSSGLEVAARHARGALLLAEGRAADALPVLREACRTSTELAAPYDCARVRVLLARAYGMLDDAEASSRELEAALEAFERLGAVEDLRLAAALRGPRPLPGGLTPREAEVLALVASGRTNRAIAAELAVSEKTVARHLANIYAKLGVTSRTAAAAFAFEHGLAAGAGPTPR
jgi:DNA-binding NarL/FixJ family response regulator